MSMGSRKSRQIICGVFLLAGFAAGAERRDDSATELTPPRLDQNLQVIILAGQSNAVGYGSNANQLPPELYAPQTDVLFWYEEGPYNSIHNPSWRISSGGQFVPLRYQTDAVFGTFGGIQNGFGPEIKLGRDAQDAPGWNVAILKFAINATSLAVDWDPDTGDSLYLQMIPRVNAALAGLANSGYEPRLRGFMWMQGEWDARSTIQAGQYAANLTEFIERLRAELSEPGLPFVIGRLNSEIWRSGIGITQANLATVRAAQRTVAATVPKTFLINTDDIPQLSDRLHFSAAGQLELGARFAEAHWALSGVPGDLDLDGDQDAADWLAMSACFTGPDGLVGPGCYAGDLAGGSDVDMADFAAFQAAFGVE